MNDTVVKLHGEGVLAFERAFDPVVVQASFDAVADPDPGRQRVETGPRPFSHETHATFDRRAVSGIRVHRGFQDFGSVDTYEFQLQCLEDEDEVAAALNAAAGSSRGLSAAAAELLSLGADEAYKIVNALIGDTDAPADAELLRRAAASGGHEGLEALLDEL